MGRIRRRVEEVVLNSLENNGVVHIEIEERLVPFEPPVCGSCHQHMRNVSTIEGKRRYQCVTWGCTNVRMYDEEGHQLGQSSGNSPDAA